MVSMAGEMRTREPGLKDLVTDTTAVAYTEYVIVLCLVTLIGAMAIAGVGIPLLSSYHYTRTLVVVPIP